MANGPAEIRHTGGLLHIRDTLGRRLFSVVVVVPFYPFVALD